MKTEVKKIDGVKRELKVEITGDRIKNKFEDVYKEVAKEAKLPGFRQGNVPRDLVEKNFSGIIHERVMRELVSDIYSEAVTKEALDVVELPEITDVKLDRTLLSFVATVSVNPEIAVKNYKGIKINYKAPVTSEDEVKRYIDSLKEQKKIESIDDVYARGLGYPDLAALQESIRRQMLTQKENVERQKAEQQVIDSLLKDQNFQVPESMIQRQLQESVRQAKIDLAMRGMPREKIEEQEENIKKELLPQAQKQVRLFMVLSHIAKQENIPAGEHMPNNVMEMLLREAKWDIS
jgi:FKBP-type peptidyl-prolyl cis-trans isomerase (trigger factor)